MYGNRGVVGLGIIMDSNEEKAKDRLASDDDQERDAEVEDEDGKKEEVIS